MICEWNICEYDASTLKVTVQPKIQLKIVFQTQKTFVHIQNQMKIFFFFFINWAIFDPPLKVLSFINLFIKFIKLLLGKMGSSYNFLFDCKY